MADNSFRDLHIKQIAEAEAMLAAIPPDPAPPPPAPPPGPPAPPPAGTLIPAGTLLAGQPNPFTLTLAQRVRYGADTRWWAMDLQPGVHNAADPVPFQDAAYGVPKTAVSMGAATGEPAGLTLVAAPPPPAPPPPPPPPAPPPPPTFGFLANENEQFTLTASTLVRFGVGTTWNELTLPSGEHTCNFDTFGDPADGEVKTCEILGGTTAPPPGPPAPPPPPAPPAPPSGTGALNADGTVNAANYRALAANMGHDAGIDYRYGPSAAAYGVADADLPALVLHAAQSLDPISYQWPANAGINWLRGCDLGKCGTWQVGGPPLAGQGGAFSSNHGQMIFVPDNADERVGVADLLTLAIGENIASMRPEPPWWWGGTDLDSRNHKRARNENTGGAGSARYPVAVARGDGRPGWNINTAAAYESGLIVTAGQNTSNQFSWVKLPDDKRITALNFSNSNEFLFAAVWDTTALKGQIAVISCASVPDGVLADTPRNQWSGEWRGHWRGLFPGIAGLGCVGWMKLLGYVDLPDMKCPTELSSTMHHDWELANWVMWPDRAGTPGGDFYEAGDRAAYREGGSRGHAIGREGLLLVISKEEKKATFVDFTPLLKYAQDKTLGTADYPGVGMGDNEFPQTFGAVGSQKPTIIKTISFNEKPTAVQCFPFAAQKRAWIATQDGKLHIFDLGDYPARNGGNPASIVKVGEVAVSRNPTGIALSRRKPGGRDDHQSDRYFPGGDHNRVLIVTCRGDRCLDWVEFAADFRSGTVPRTLKDKRLKDPIRAQDGDTHTTESYVVTVADYAGKQAINYRYGPVIFWWHEGVMSDNPDYPMSFDWTACLPEEGEGVPSTTFNGVEYKFSCGGFFPIQGKPFHFDQSNVF